MPVGLGGSSICLSLTPLIYTYIPLLNYSEVDPKAFISSDGRLLRGDQEEEDDAEVEVTSESHRASERES